MKAILIALFVALLMVGCGESSQPSEDVDTTDTETKVVPLLLLWKKNDNNQTLYGTSIFTGLGVSLRNNGTKICEVNYKNGRIDGPSIGWYENGRKRFESNYKDGKLMEALSWKPNGERCRKTYVREGNGVWVSYDEYGKIIRRTTYKDGKELVW